MKTGIGFSTGLAVLLTASLVVAEPQTRHDSLRQEATKSFDQGNWQKVVAIAARILQDNPKDYAAMHLLGSARIEMGIATQNARLIRQGITDARQAITDAGSKADFNYYLPYLYGMTNLSKIEGQPSHAQVSAQIATQLLGHPRITTEQKANTLYQRGLAHSAQKKTPEAVQDFRQAIAIVPKHMAAYLAIADAYAETGKTEQAIQSYAEIVRAFPEDALVYNNQGMFYQNIGRGNDAIRAFTKAIQKNPQYHIAVTNRGYTWLEGGKPAEAERDFSASLRIDPNQPPVYGMRGSARLVQGNWKGALEDYNMVVRAHPNDAIAHADAGFARFFGKDYAGALAEFNRAVQLDPSARFIQPWRCWTMVRMNRTSEAASLAQASRAKTASQRDWIDHLILYHVGEITGDELLNRIDRRDPKVQAAQLCEARFFIAEHLAKRGDGQKAAQNYEQALRTGEKQLSAFRGASYALRRFQ